MKRPWFHVTLSAIAMALAACHPAGTTDTTPTATPSSGQVVTTPAAPRVGFYTASRLAEQASFGPTPALVAAIQARGLEGWIDDQFALPASQINLTPFLVDPVPNTDWEDAKSAFPDLTLSAPDQLRLRVTWVLSQHIVINAERGDNLGRLVFQNLLASRALGTYEQLLYDVSVNAHIGEQFDNRTNRPRSEGCAGCAPNHNYARVLLEQYTLGTAKLNGDGSEQRDAFGRVKPAYSARDVQELTRALTGWSFRSIPAGTTRLGRDWGNWREPMVASTWPGDRDFDAKQLLGTAIPAYQAGAQELQQVLGVLAAQPNTGIRLARALIQGFVKSQPSTAYLQRVVSVYNDNGKGVRGDLRAMVKAVLLDAEARAADDPLKARSDDGRLREPLLVHTALYRVMGCQRVPRWSWGGLRLQQTPFQPATTRGHIDATARSPVSHANAPEQPLLNAQEFNVRSDSVSWLFEYDSTGRPDATRSQAVGCSFDDASARYQRSTAEFYTWMGERFFRGALPPALRQNLDLLARQQPWNTNFSSEAPTRLLSYALMSPYWGVIE